MFRQITIDGPAGSGKSTAAEKLAKMIDYKYISSGLIYRSIVHYLLLNKTDANINDLNKEDFDSLISKFNFNIDKDGKIIVNDIDISQELYNDKISMYTSILSQKDFIREYVNEYLIKISKMNNIVVDGRDMGTVVFKDAYIKFYLDASLDVRAQRRYDQLVKQNKEISLDNIKEEIRKRDENDKNRISSPLSVAVDAYVIDSDKLTIGEVVNKMYEIVKEKLYD